MKKQFFDHMHEVMDKNKDVYFLMAGLGWPRVDEFLKKYPDRAFNTEASEQTALDIAVGLAYAGKTPVIYTISPFLLRGFETIRTYIDHEELHVIMIGAGRDTEYADHDGFSHDESDMKDILDVMYSINKRWPLDVFDMKANINVAVKSSKPWYINIKRG